MRTARRPSTTLAAVAVSALVALGLGGCSSDDDNDGGTPSATASDSASVASSTPSPTATGDPSETPTATSEPSGDTAEVALTVEGTTVTGSTRIQVAPGQHVRLTVTADRSSELHVHAADPEIESETKAGEPVTVEFDAPGEPGVYEVELHDPDLLLLEVEVEPT